MSIASTWPVLITRRAGVADCDGDGRIDVARLRDWFEDAVTAVLDACPAAEAAAPRAVTGTVLTGTLTGAGAVAVAAGVTEVYPASVVVAGRLVPDDAAVDGAVNARAEVVFHDASGAAVPISKALRDAFIAMTHNARHYA